MNIPAPKQRKWGDIYIYY